MHKYTTAFQPRIRGVNWNEKRAIMITYLPFTPNASHGIGMGELADVSPKLAQSHGFHINRGRIIKCEESRCGDACVPV